MENMVNIFNNIYQNKKVLITGHTGFKGSWLSFWLKMLGAEVAGYSLYLPSQPNNFEVLNLQKNLNHNIADTRNLESMKQVFQSFQPEIVFHLASQPIVKKSFKEPRLTFESNIMGAINVMECAKSFDCVKAVVVITSDKAYRNVEWKWGYRENDELGGHDPYSASKGCVEIACRSYHQSFFADKDYPRIATTRAGNVIGGGDWAENRIVPDCIRALNTGQEIEIRNPHATRPWQHVLEPLSGYLLLGAKLMTDKSEAGEAYNFGPSADVTESVGVLANELTKHWGTGNWNHIPDQDNQKESTLLKLCCDKALHNLNWKPILTFGETIKFTADWYKKYYQHPDNIHETTKLQIEEYIDKAKEKKLTWAK